MNPLVSICIPTYNGSRFLAETLECAAAQTYSDIEIIVSDDRSQDGTLDIARSFAARCSRPVRIIEHVPAGMGANWNDCVREARGTYVKLLFQDDLITPDCIERQMDVAMDDPRIGLVFCPRDLIVDQEVVDDPLTKITLDRYRDLHRSWSRLERVQPGHALLSDPTLLNEPYNKIGEPSIVLARRDLIVSRGGFDGTLTHYIDVEMWLRMMTECHVGFVDQTLASFRLHRTQQTRRNDESGELDRDLHRYRERLLKGPVFDHLAPRVRHDMVRQLLADHGRWSIQGAVASDGSAVQDLEPPPWTAAEHAFGDRISRIRRALVEGVIAAAFGQEAQGGGKIERWFRRLGRAASLLPGMRWRCGGQVAWLDAMKGGRLLHVGCGAGDLLVRCRDAGWQVTGIEDDDLLRLVACRHHSLDVRQWRDGRFPCDDGQYDAVVLPWRMHGVQDRRLIVRESSRVLAPSGRIVLTASSDRPASGGLRNDGKAPAKFDGRMDCRSEAIHLLKQAGFASITCGRIRSGDSQVIVMTASRSNG